MGSPFKTTPLLIIISVTVGGAYAGILGILMVISIVVVLRDIVVDIVIYHEGKADQEAALIENKEMEDLNNGV